MNFNPRQFTARLSSLGEVLTHTETICREAGLSRDEQLKVELVIEELFTNSVCHGYGHDCNEPVWIAAENQNGNLRIIYQDAAHAYNPLTRPAGKVAPEIGGLGITLVKRYGNPHYLFEGGRNTLILSFLPSSEPHL